MIACALAGAVFDWPSWIDGIGPDLWLAFWASGAWFPHLPPMLAAFALLFLVLFGYAVAKDAERAREVEGASMAILASSAAWWSWAAETISGTATGRLGRLVWYSVPLGKGTGSTPPSHMQ